MFALGALGRCCFPHSPTYRVVTMLGSIFVLLNIDYVMLTQFNTLPHTMYIGLELVLLMIVGPFLDSEFLTGVAPAATTAKNDRAAARAAAKRTSPAEAAPKSYGIKVKAHRSGESGDHDV